MGRTNAKPAHNPKTTEHVPSGPQGNTAQRNERTQPTHEQIARRAYELFLARGGQHGNHEQDWQQAERELKLGR
jgi:hypothetical protein